MDRVENPSFVRSQTGLAGASKERKTGFGMEGGSSNFRKKWKAGRMAEEGRSQSCRDCLASYITRVVCLFALCLPSGRVYSFIGLWTKP